MATTTKVYEEELLKLIYQGDTTAFASGFYLGLCNSDGVTNETTLADLTEVTGSGYARVQLNRNSTDWGDPAEGSNSYHTESKQITFTATGDWTAFNRAFICNAASGTSGKLFIISGALTTTKTLSTGESFSLTFTNYLR